MAATLQQHCATNGSSATRTTNTATNPNPQLKRLVYSKYRELLGSYNDQANAYIDTLPSYMVQKDTGFNLELKNSNLLLNSAQQNGNATQHHQPNEMYGAGQRMPAQQTYEAPACVQNAMMTKDKKPFTYTPGGIDLSQIKSERMAKRLARNAQAEGATGIQQQNRPTQPQSPGGSSPSAAASMGAAAMGMPFQVLPPPPPPSPGKSFNGGSAPAPPPPPPSSSNFSNVGTLAPPSNGNGVGGRGSAPNSPNMPRKSPTPQRFEPPPMGFRPEIKIPPNPMAALRKVPPPVEKNTFWKDEYVKDRSKSPMVDLPHNAGSNNNSVNSNSSSPQTNNTNNNGTAILNNDNIDGFKKTMPTATTNNSMQENQTSNNYTNYQQPQQQQQQLYTPPTPPQQPQQSPIRPTMQQSPPYGGPQPPTAQLQQTHISQQTAQQQQQPYRPEFRSVAAPTSPVVNVYTRQSDTPRTAENSTPARATESPFKFSQQQQRAPTAVSPLAHQQSTPSSASSGASVSPNNSAQAVPWRTQRGQVQQPQQQVQAHPSIAAQSHPQPIYNNVQQQAQRTPDFSTQQSPYQGPKPTNIGSLYIAPLAPPTEPQAQHIVRQQMQQQQQQQQQQLHRDSPINQMAPQHQPNQQLRWMSSQPMNKEQPAWARPEENGNVVPSSLNRIKLPPPPATSSPPSQAAHQIYHQPLNQGNGFMPQTTGSHNFGAQPLNTTGLRLQINTPINQANTQNAPKERIIPIQLEQTPTYTPAQPSFNHGAGSNSPAPGYVMRTPNQFVDQGYNNFGQQQQQQQQPHQQQQAQRVISPTLQQLNAPRMVQQTQNNAAAGNKTHIIPITIENNEGSRGPISKTPIVIQNDQRTPPVQSKSFRILQKITDTIDDGTNGDNAKQQQQPQHMLQEPIEPQLQRPTFARQMSAQQARHSPTVEQMRRMQIGHEQGNYSSAPTTPSAFKYNQQRSFNDNSQKYVPPSEQQVAEPKKYTGSAIPSRSFKILQAMTQPENADKIIKEKQENCGENNEIGEIETNPESNNFNSCALSSSSAEPALSSSSATINSELSFSSSSSPTTQPLPPYPPYPYAYGYPWYLPPPPHHMSATQNCNPQNWHYPYGMPAAAPTPTPADANREQLAHYPPYPYYYPYYPALAHSHNPSHIPNHVQPQAPTSECEMQTMYPSYMPPSHPYLAYPYPVVPSYSQGSNSSRASSVLPDIIITPSTDEVTSKVSAKKRAASVENVTSLKSYSPTVEGSSVVGALTQELANLQQCLRNNLNTNCQTIKSFNKNIEGKSPEENTSPVPISMTMAESALEMDETSSDSEVTPKQVQRKEPVPLQSIKSVNNVQIYEGKNLHELEPELTSDSEDTQSKGADDDDDDDETTADGESDIFDEEDETTSYQHDFELEQDSETEELIIDDSLSVIYEEESEVEKSCNINKSVKQNANNSNNENVKSEEEEHEDSTSVTVRLPLKFSFNTSGNNGNIATVEVGKSQVQEQHSNKLLSGIRNQFNVASITSSDTDDDKDEALEDCDVSVTISLSQSSRSSSLDNQQIYKTMDHLYTIADMPMSEEGFDKLEDSSQEDVSASFSLNMRNKFANETNKDGFTNNIAIMEEDKEISDKQEVENDMEVPEELDFFATLMATKMQAQKIKEQSASYWGKSQEKAEPVTDIQENHQEQTTSKESKLNGRKKTLKKTKPKAKIVKKANDLKENEEIKNKKLDQIGDTSFKKQEKPKFSFWDRCSSESAAEKVQEQEFNKHNENKQAEYNKHQREAECNPNSNESQKFISQHQVDTENSSIHSANTLLNSHQMESCADVQESEEIADIWADREDDLPPIKPIKSKLKSLEKARQSFWSSAYESEVKEAEKLPEKVTHKSAMQTEMINKVDLNVQTLSYTIKETCQPQQAIEDFVAEEKAEDSEDSQEVDFWAEINKAKLNKSPQSRQEPSASSNLQDFNSKDFTLTSSVEDQEYIIYNDECMSNSNEFDPFKYPEEPREVDTDEEIDFWAEIEAKKQAKEDDVTFHKSALFWASKERENSVDETPYKPVLPKAFPAKLPDEPPSQNISIWAALEAHKGEEPVIIDPVEEEEKFLAQQYDVMITKQELVEDEELNDSTSSAHELIEDSLRRHSTQKQQEQELQTEIQLEEESVQDTNEKAASKTEIDELEIKRSNYRKAMAFFTTSIDENKEQNNERYERSKSKYGRNSSCIEEESEKWDWDAVNEALEQEKENLTEISTENKQQEANAKEQTTQIDITEYSNRFCEPESLDNNDSTLNNSQINSAYNDLAVPTTIPLITYATNNPEGKDLKEAWKDSSLKPANLEVNKFNEDKKISVKDRISAFETGTVEKSAKEVFRNSMQKQSLSVESSTRQSSLSRNSSTQRSESEMDEDDSGVTDMNKQLSETDTESESFPELRKMSSYQRASTHSRLFKLLQEDPDIQESHNNADEYQFKPSRKKIIHNVSITRKQNPTALAEAETMSQRRERLSLPLCKNTSIDNDNPSTPNSPASPIMGHAANKSPVVSEKLVSELVQSLLLKSDSTLFRKLPMEKLQAAAKKVLEEELDSLENTAIDSTAALTANDMKKHKSYNDYYNTWSDALGTEDIVPSKSFRALQDSRRTPWTARCPRVLSSKTINRDLARVTESPEITASSRQSRETSIGKWKKS